MLTTIGFAVLYAVAMYAGRETHVPPSQLALAWPAAGVVIVWFLACTRTAGVLVATAIVTVISGLMNQVTGVEPVGGWLFGLVNVSTGLVGAWVLRRTGRWAGPRGVRSAADLRDLGLASVAGAAVSAVSGGVVAWTRFGNDLWDGMALIGFRNGLSAFVVVVVLLAVPELGRRTGGSGPRTVLWAAGALVLSTLLMESSWPVGFTMIPPLLVIAMRCGYAVTAVVGGLQGVIIVTATVAGRGPFAAVAQPQDRVVLAQVLILVLMLVGVVVAMAEQDRAQALRDSRRDRDRLRDHMDAALVANAHLAVGTTGEPVVVDANAALCALTRRYRDVLVGVGPVAWLAPGSVAALSEGVADLVGGRARSWRGRLELDEAHGGAVVDAALSVVTTRAEHGALELNLQMIDITAQAHAEKRLADLALHDELTGLPNRALWADRLRMALSEASRSGDLVGVLYVDVDHFKAVNDTHGHDVGDELLREIARRLSSIVRPHDTVARIGGDEFVVLCPSLGSQEDGTRLAARIQQVMAAPVDVGFIQLAPTVSIGVTFATGEDDPRIVIRRADSALYTAKGRGRSRFEVYHADLHEVLEESARVLVDLERAHRRGDLKVHYQTIVEGRTGRPLAIEALLRWERSDGVVVLPDGFLDVLEGSDLIHGVGEEVLRQACRDGAELRLRGLPLAVHVNVSARELSRPGLVTRVRRALDESRLPPDLLVLEITETRLVTVNGSLLRDLLALRELGVRIAVDDFGTGYSALTHLVDLPVDLIKLDRGFVAEMVGSPTARAITAGVSAMAAGIGITAVAEGVETYEQADLLLATGYEHLQGYLFSRPRSMVDLLEELSRRTLLEPAAEGVRQP